MRFKAPDGTPDRDRNWAFTVAFGAWNLST
jgi:hypothetical protein